MEIQYLDNITKKNYLCSRRRLRRLRRLGGLRGLGRMGRLGGLGQVGRVGQVRQVGVRAAPAIEGRLGGVDVYTSVIIRLLFAYRSLFLYRSYIICKG